MITFYKDRRSLSLAAAELFARRSEEAIQANGRFSVVLSGGSTPLQTYGLLARPPYSERIAWEQVHVFWGDERCVPFLDTRNNAHHAHRALLDHIPVPRKQIHPIPTDIEPAEAARAYEATIRAFFGDRPPQFDLVFLGLGDNGHVASLFPGHPALQETTRWVVDVTTPGQNLRRITMTALLFNQAAAIAFLALGAGKAWILRDALQGPQDPLERPAQLIHPEHGTVSWLVDDEAGSLINRQL